jgi:hypothetical protein
MAKKSKIMKLVKTLGFYHSVFLKFKSWTPANLCKPALALALRTMGAELTGQ